MNDSQDEGFYEPVIQTFTQNLLKQQSGKNSINGRSFKIRPILSVHYQITLYEYPYELDNINRIDASNAIFPSDSYPINVITKTEEDAIPLSDYFPRNLQCVYNKFREKLSFKRDLTRNRQKIQSQFEIQVDRLVMSNSIPLITVASSTNNKAQRLVQTINVGTYILYLNNGNNKIIIFCCKMIIRSLKHQKGSFIIANLSRFVSFEGEISILTYSHNKKKFERKVRFVTAVSKFCRCDNEQSYWSLLFDYQFEKQSDIYFCLTLPYSYSKILRFVKSLSQVNIKNVKIYIQNAAKSPLGNIIPSINILKDKSSKKIIFITARQHPSQTVGSYFCQSIIRKLCDQSILSESLLQRFRFVIIPMVNVDGVIHGNSRTNLMGYDLNRSWDRNGIAQSIECQQIWRYLENISNQGEIVWSFDLHGHSRQHGFFAYFSEQNDKNLIITHLLSSKSSIFRANKCVYQIGASKRQSLRSQLYQRMRILNSVTIQISLFGFYDEDKQFIQFQQSHFDQMAAIFLQSLLQTQKISNKKISKYKNIEEIIKKMQKKNSIHQDEDSDPDPQGDYLKKQERAEVQQLPQAKYQKKFSQSRLLNFQSKGIIYKKRLKTQSSKMQNYTTQKISAKNQFLQVKSFLKALSPQQKRKSQKKQIYNLTFSNRCRSYNKNQSQSQQVGKKPKIINIGEKQQPQNKGRNNFVYSSQSLRKSLDMRKKIKLAFDNRLKTDRGPYMTHLGINPSQSNRLKVFIYPSLKEKEKLQIEELEHKKCKSKSFGTSLYSRFHNSFYLKIKHQ